MYDALTTALKVCQSVAPNTPDRIRIHPSLKDKKIKQQLTEDVQSLIVFLSDGEPTSGEIVDRFELLKNITYLNKDPVCPIFSLAFGKQADYTFLQKISYYNRGVSRKVYESTNADENLSKFIRIVASPVMSNVSFHYVITGISTSDDKNEKISLHEIDEISGELMYTIGENEKVTIAVEAWDELFGLKNITLWTKVEGRAIGSEETIQTEKISFSMVDCNCIIEDDSHFERLRAYKNMQMLLMKRCEDMVGFEIPDDTETLICNAENNREKAIKLAKKVW